MDCTIRTMRRDELPVAIEWAAREGWNPGLHDAACFYAADPEGFLIAERGAQPLGCISAVSYAGRFGFIGLFIVAPAWRGQGVGARLWARAMSRLAGHVIGLDGVPAQQDYYRRSGFKLAWWNVRFAGVARSGQPAAHPHIVQLGTVDFAALCAVVHVAHQALTLQQYRLLAFYLPKSHVIGLQLGFTLVQLAFEHGIHRFHVFDGADKSPQCRVKEAADDQH